MSAVLGSPDSLTLAQAALIMREATKDKTYQLSPLGQEVAGYLRAKRKRLTDKSEVAYESALACFARYFADLQTADFEPPAGVELVEKFLDDTYGAHANATYNKNLSIIGDFLRFQIKRGRLHGDPTLPIERARREQVYRTTFPDGQRHAVVAAAEELRDRLALRLLFDYGLRKGSLRAIQFKHFDHQRWRLTIFAKGSKVRPIPIPHSAFWMDLERHLLDAEAQPSHFLLPGGNGNQHRRTLDPSRPMSEHRAHDWWYERLEAAGIVATGQRNGERMHKARHTAGQRMLDATGNLKAVQMQLGHADISTTANTYVGWDEGQLADSLAAMIEGDTDDAA